MKLIDKAKMYGNKIAGVGALSLVAVSAHAGDLADAITGELSGGKLEVLAVGAVILGLCGVLLLVKMTRRSAS